MSTYVFENEMSVDDVIHELMVSAREGKVIELVYKYLKNPAERGLRTAMIQPLKWSRGSKGDTQVLAWDIEKEAYRKYSLPNVICIVKSDMNWLYELEHDLLERPV